MITDSDVGMVLLAVGLGYLVLNLRDSVAEPLPSVRFLSVIGGFLSGATALLGSLILAGKIVIPN